MLDADDKALAFIKSYIEEHKRSPSYRMIAEGIGFSKNSKAHICRIVKRLKSRGFITNSTEKYRSLSVVTHGA